MAKGFVLGLPERAVVTGLLFIRWALVIGILVCLGLTACPTEPPEDQTKPQLQGTVTISGTAEVGQTLTANLGGITNGTGTVTFQWKSDEQDIAGAINSIYTLTNAEEGKAITVEVNCSGNTGSVTSNPTVAVRPVSGAYAVLDGKFNVFQDAGVTDAEMEAVLTKITTTYNNEVSYAHIDLDGKLAEIHIIPQNGLRFPILGNNYITVFFSYTLRLYIADSRCYV
ncbi:MAG: hypothetical protein LBH57_03590 [Treponema sp.]|jgi:hypothetical protein|nr:hypothetical protein [Treponema sp.]